MVIDFILQTQGRSLRSALGEWRSRSDNNCVGDYSFHMAVTDFNDNTKQEVREMIEKEGIVSFKTFMAYKGALMIDDRQITASSRLDNPLAWSRTAKTLGWQCSPRDPSSTTNLSGESLGACGSYESFGSSFSPDNGGGFLVGGPGITGTWSAGSGTAGAGCRSAEFCGPRLVNVWRWRGRP